MIWLDPNTTRRRRGSLLSLSHGQELFQKSTEVSYKKKNSGQILSGKYFSRKEWLNQIKQDRKKSLCQITDG